MRAQDLIRVQVYDGSSSWVDISDGILNIDITTGAQEYTGPFTQPDVGEANIISRNILVDPYTNELIKYGQRIRITANSVRIFTGKIDGVRVEYLPNGKEIVTIKALDMIGTLQKHVLSDDFIALQENWTTEELLNELNLKTEIPDFQFNLNLSDATEYASAPITSGTTAWEAISSRVKTDLGFVYANTRDYINYIREDISSPSHPANSDWILLFDYDGNGVSYEDVRLSDGFDRVVNDLEVTGTGETTTTTIRQTAGGSVSLWGKAAAAVDLMTDDNTTLQNIANAALTELAEPQKDIYTVSWYPTRNLTSATEGNPYATNVFNVQNGLSQIQINHKIKEDLYLNRKYQVIGQKHEISANDWRVTYTLRNWFYQSTVTPNPVIVVDPEGGTPYIDYDFSYTYPNMAEITGQTWDLGDGITSTDPTVTVDYEIPGLKTIVLTVDTIYGYQKTSTIQIEIAETTPESTWSYTVDEFYVYTFTYTGEGASTFSWNFDSGTANPTSLEANPTRYWTTGGSKTISLTATNSYGSSTTTQVIDVVAIENIPVQYVRFRFSGVRLNKDSFNTYHTGAGTYEYSALYKAYLYSLNLGRELNDTEVEIIDFKQFNGYLAQSNLSGFDSYSRTPRFPLNTLKAQLFGNAVGGVYPYVESISPADQSKINFYFTVNLKKEYLDLSNILFTKTPNPGGAKTILGQGTTIYVDVSQDNSTWYHATTLTVTGNGSYTQFTHVSGLEFPPKRALASGATVPAVDPIRYIKYTLKGYTPPTIPSRYWQFCELMPMNGSCIPYAGTFNDGGIVRRYPQDNTGNVGGIDLNTKTGGTISYPINLNPSMPTINYRQKVPASSTFFLQPPQTFPMANNYSNNEGLYWGSSNFPFPGDRTFIMDLGENRYDITGFLFDKRGGTQATTESWKPNRDFQMQIQTSLDGVNFTNLGTYNLGSEASGAETTNGVIIRVPQVVETISGTTYTYYNPIDVDSPGLTVTNLTNAQLTPWT